MERTIKVIDGNDIINKRIGARCYFCRKHIDNDIILLVDEYSYGYSIYPIDLSCFRQAQFNFYLGNIPFSVN